MLDFVIGVIIITVAGFIGTWFFSVIILPIVYGIPKAFLLCRRGILKYSVIFAYLKPVVLWIVVFGIIAFITRIISKTFFMNTLGSTEFFVGFLLGMGITLGYSFSRKSRQDLQKDFWAFVHRYRQPESTSPRNGVSITSSKKTVVEGQIDKKGWKFIQFLWLNLLNILGNYEKAHFEIGYIHQHMKDCFTCFKKTSYIDNRTRYHFKIRTERVECSTLIKDKTGVIDKEIWTRTRYLWLQLVGILKHYSNDCKELEYAWYRLLDLLESLDRVPFTEDGVEYKYKIDTIEEKRSQKYYGDVSMNVNLAGMIINEMNYIVHECNKYIKKEEFNDNRLFKFDFTIASIYIALVLKYIEKYEIYGLKNTLINELKDFFRSFVDPDKIDVNSEGFNWLVEMVDYLEKTLPSIQNRDTWYLRVKKLLSETAESEIREFFVGSYDEKMISVLLNHIELTSNFLKERLFVNKDSANIPSKKHDEKPEKSKRLSIGVHIISIIFIILGGMWVLSYILNPIVEMSGYFMWGIPYLVGGIGMLCRRYWALRFSQVYLILTALPVVGIFIWALFQPEKAPFFVFVLMVLMGAIFCGLPLWFLFKKSTIRQFKK